MPRSPPPTATRWRDTFMAEYRAVFSGPGERLLRFHPARPWRRAGGSESDQILGFLLEAARRAGVPAELHEAAFLHAKAYEQRPRRGPAAIAGRSALGRQNINRACTATMSTLAE
jgi:hypothetical protein